jgi:hypothetical protein
MLTKVARDRKELLDIMDAVEMLGFDYVTRSQGGTYTVDIIQSEEDKREEEKQEAATKPKRVCKTMNRRNTEEILADNVAISDFLRGRGERLTTTPQIREHLKRLGLGNKTEIDTTAMRLAARMDANIVIRGGGYYSYKSEV